MVVRLRGNRDDCIVPETISARRQRHTTDDVPVAVDEFFGAQIIAERQRFEEHGVVAVGTELQVDEKHRRAGDFVDEAATNPHRDIEVRLNVRRLHARPH